MSNLLKSATKDTTVLTMIVSEANLRGIPTFKSNHNRTKNSQATILNPYANLPNQT